jgi:hypothetical protein
MPARRQNGPRSGTHLGTSAATARSAKAEIAKSEYCSRFPISSKSRPDSEMRRGPLRSKCYVMCDVESDV